MAQLPPNMMVIRKALKGSRAIYTIKKHPKLYLAADGDGGGSWRIKYRIGAGRGAPRRWHTISNDARNAEFEDIVLKANALLNNLALHGIDPRTTRPKVSETFDAAFTGWLDSYAKIHKRSWQADEKLYKRHVKRRLGGDALRGITRTRVIGVLDDIARKVTPLQANHCQSLISAVLSWSLDEGKIETHPALRIRRRGQSKPRAFVLTDDQLQTFWQGLDGLHRNAAIMIRLLLLLGSRLGETSRAAKAHLRLDDEQPIWLLPKENTKNGLEHLLPLPSDAAALFGQAGALKPESPFVFPARRVEPAPLDGNQASRQCKILFEAMNLGHMCLHDLRHQAATGMAACGVPRDIREIVQNQITGRRQTIGAVYDQWGYFDEKLRALTLWQNRLRAIVRGEPLPAEKY